MNLKPSRLAALALSVGLIGPASAAPAEPTLSVETDVREEYYEVRGNNAGEVFQSIQRKGLGGKAGLTASGLTHSELSYSLSTVAHTPSCDDATLSLVAKVLVTLPRHARPSELTEAGRRHWEAYETLVEYHEYRHVEIEFQGLSELQKELQRRMKSVSPYEERNCVAVIEDAIAKQSRTTADRHKKFHARESKSVKASQKNTARSNR